LLSLLVDQYNQSEGTRCWWLTAVILVTWEAKIERTVVQDQPGHTVSDNSISQITRVKWTRDMSQVIELLLCKLEALSSNPSPTKKKKKERKKQSERLCFRWSADMTETQ
jgi:hypothetical protein